MLCSFVASGSALERQEVSVEETARTVQVTRDSTQGESWPGKSILSGNWRRKILTLNFQTAVHPPPSPSPMTHDIHPLKVQGAQHTPLLPGQRLRGYKGAHQVPLTRSKCLDTLLPPGLSIHQCERKACLQVRFYSLYHNCFNTL